MKFKVGDKVKIFSIDLETIGSLKFKDIGKICTVTRGYERTGGDVYILDDNKYSANFTESSLRLAKIPLKNPTHLVVWDEESRDPHKFFTNEKEAKEYVKELSENSSVKKDSIILVEIKSAQKVNIIKNVRLNQYKI